MPALNALATTPFAGNRTYSDVVHFVHVYVPEPHPKGPDPSPYTGSVMERGYSERRQPRTYDERVAVATEVAAMLEGHQRLLVDELSPRRSNPVWCSYGPMPNSAYLIDQSGVMRVVQLWVDAAKMQTAIDELLSE